MATELLVTLLSDTARLPRKMYHNDAGIDLFSDEEGEIGPYENKKISTGIAVAIPKGHCLVIKDRSGIATKTRCCVVAGVIDEQYRGPIIVAFENHGGEHIPLRRGDRIAQALLLPVPEVDIVEVPELPETDRGENGFGSTDEASAS